MGFSQRVDTVLNWAELSACASTRELHWPTLLQYVDAGTQMSVANKTNSVNLNWNRSGKADSLHRIEADEDGKNSFIPDVASTTT